MQHQPSLRSYLLLLGIGIVWGGQFLFNAQAVEGFPPATIAAIRVLIGALTLTVVTYFVREVPADRRIRRGASDFALLAFIATFDVVLPLFLITWGQQRVASSVTAVMVGSVPIITLVFSMFMSQRKSFTFNSGLCVVLGFLGIVVLVNPSAAAAGTNHIGYELAVFLGAACFGISLNLMERMPSSAPIRSTRDMLWIASVPLVIASLVHDQPWALHWTRTILLSLLLLGTLGSGMAYLMYTALVQRAGSVFTSLSNFIVPLVGVILGVAVRGEAFGARQGWALALIIAALAANEMRAFVRVSN